MYTFVHAAHETLKARCGANYSGVCANFYLDPGTNDLLLEEMLKASFVDPSGARFEFIGREGNIGREIVYFDGSQMTTVSFLGGNLQFYTIVFLGWNHYENILAKGENGGKQHFLLLP